MPSVYVGSSLLNATNTKRVIDRFTTCNIQVTYDWTTHGQIKDEDKLAEISQKEINGVKDADLFFMLSPARMGTHVELGLAIAYNKPVVIVTNHLSELKSFYYAPNVFRFSEIETAFVFALELLNERLSA